MTASAEALLVERARDGDRDAFDTLVDARLEATFAAVAAILNDGDDPAEATRRVFARAWRDLPRLDHAPRFDSWFGRIVVEACRSQGRGRGRKRGARGRGTSGRENAFSDDTTTATGPTGGGRRGLGGIGGRGGPRVREIHVAAAPETRDLPAGVIDLRRGEGDPLTRSLARLSVAERTSLYLHAHDRLSAAVAGRRLGISARGAWSTSLAARSALAQSLVTDTGEDPDTWPADDAIRAALERRAAARPAPWDLRSTVAEALRTTGQVPRWRARLGRAFTVRRLRLVSVAALASVAAALIIATALDHRTSPAPQEALRRPGLLAFLLDGDVYLADADGVGSVRVLHADGVRFDSVAWSPTRNVLAATTSEAVFVLDASTLAVRRVATGRFAAWSPDGLFIAVIEGSSDLSGGSSRIRIVWVADGRTNLEVVVPTPSGVVAATWSPDGRWLAAASSSHLTRIDARTGLVAQIARFTRTWFDVASPAWSPDSRRIAYVDMRSNFDGGTVGDACSDDCTATIVTIGIDGTDPLDLYAETAMQTQPTWSPDGSSIAYMTRAGGTGGPGWLSVMRLGDAKPKLLVEGTIDAFAWAPDGTSITIQREPEFQPNPLPHWLMSSVRVADGDETRLPLSEVGLGFALQVLAPDAATSSLPTVTGSPEPSLAAEPLASPADGKSATPTGWSGVAFDATITDGAGSECVEAIIRSLAPRRTVVTRSFCGENFNQGQWAPDGSVYAAISDERLVMVSRAGTVRPVAGILRPDILVWSPDAHWLAVRACQPEPDFRPAFVPTVCSWSLVRADDSTTRALPGTPSWSANGARLLVTLSDGRVVVGHSDGSALEAVDALPTGSTLSPDGADAVFVRDGDAWVMPLPNGTPRNVSRFDFGGVNAVEWSPDGRWIVAIRNQQVWLLQVDGQARRRIGLDAPFYLNGWRWAPDGRHLAIVGWHNDTGVPDTAIVSLDGAPTVLLEAADAPLWSLDGRYLAVADRPADGGFIGIDIVNADGSGRTTIWTGNGNNLPQAWIR